MIHIFYLSLIGLIVFFGGRELRRTRRAFFAASEQRDIEIAARKEADLTVARLRDSLGAARRREMENLGALERKTAQLNRAEATIGRLYVKLKETEFDDAPLLASSEQLLEGQRFNQYVRVTGQLSAANPGLH